MRRISLLWVLLITILLVCSSCVSTQPISSTEINIPKNSVFYVDSSDDNLGVSSSIIGMIEEHGFKGVLINDISQIPAKQASLSSGTGFFISPRVVITNAHVVNGRKNVKIVKNGIEYSANVIFSNDSNDIAILETQEFDVPCFKLTKAEDYKVTDSIFVLGYPMSDILGSEIRITNGIINSLSGINADSNTMQISAQIQPGNSGGPVINESYMVVGMASSKLSDSYTIAAKNTIAQNVNFAIKSEVLKLFCDSYITDSNNFDTVNSIQDAIDATVMIISGGETYTNDKYYYISYGYRAEWDVFHWTATSMNMACYDVDSGDVVARVNESYFSLSDVYDIAKSQVISLLKKIK